MGDDAGRLQNNSIFCHSEVSLLQQFRVRAFDGFDHVSLLRFSVSERLR
jgi:hypothetical protein